MGYFSNMDIVRERDWGDRSYPTRRETLGWFMENLITGLHLAVSKLIR